jgi:hypothetical protein
VRPVLLVTLDVRLDPAATAFGVDSAVEAGQPLVVVNVVASALLPCSTLLGYEYLPRPEVEASLRAQSTLARSLGVRVERIRLCSPHPVDALLAFAAERGTGLLVFGPDPAQLRPRRYRKVLRSLERSAACLVWAPDQA